MRAEGTSPTLERRLARALGEEGLHGPLQVRIWDEKDPQTQQLSAIRIYISTYEQNRTIWMDGRPHPSEYAPHTWQGFSTGKWEGDILTVYTTHLKQEWVRRNGVPNSEKSTMIEHFIRHGNIMTHLEQWTDPVYLTEPLWRSEEFVLNERGEIAAATMANIFWAKGGTVYTPALSTGAVAGITRGTVLKLAEQELIPVIEGVYELGELVEADEIFLTSANFGVAIVTTFDFRQYAVTADNLGARLTKAFRNLVRGS